MDIYYDEPIRRPASYRPPAAKTELPKRYLEMKSLAAKHCMNTQSAESLFYKQGMFMADFEDDYTFHGNFIRYYPTYQSMNNEQLRAYFSWRTKVRHGEIRKTELSFVYVYIYELLNQIGVSSAEEGFYTLQNFQKAYKDFDFRTEQFVKTWLKDYVIYNNLDSSLIEEFSISSSYEKALINLIRFKDLDLETLFTSLCELSSYKLCNSRFYKAYPEDVQTVVCNVYNRICEHYDKHKKCSYFNHLFGNMMVFPRNMFSFAVFYDRRHYENYDYVISDIHKYHCRNGRWTLETYPSAAKKNAELGLILRSIDRIMREVYHYKYKLKSEPLPVEPEALILKETERLLAQKKKLSLPRIEIDISRLSAIRQASVITRDKLITEEERGIEEEVKEESQEPANTSGILDDTEYQFVRCLIEGIKYDELLREKALSVSILADSVNEKLFDLFQDTVIVFDGDKPELIEDYIDELKGLIK